MISHSPLSGGMVVSHSPLSGGIGVGRKISEVSDLLLWAKINSQTKANGNQIMTTGVKRPHFTRLARASPNLNSCLTIGDH